MTRFATDQVIDLDDSHCVLETSPPPSYPATATLEWRPIPWWKRTFDIVASAVLLVVTAPLLICIGLFIRLVSKGPILFRQSRLGERGKPFVIFKFRTMHVCDESEVTTAHRDYVAGLSQQNTAAVKPSCRNRLIRGGEFLRSHSMDELPQLINVFLGSMSLVGPRPEVLEWEDYEPWQLRRFEATPGMTGLWQVSGKNRLTFNQMIDLDIAYVEQRSAWLDLKILLRTVNVVLGRTNS